MYVEFSLDFFSCFRAGLNAYRNALSTYESLPAGYHTSPTFVMKVYIVFVCHLAAAHQARL